MNQQTIRFIEEPHEIHEVLKVHGLLESKIFILADKHTIENCLPLLYSALPAEGRHAILLDIPSGESSKRLEVAEELYTKLITHGADRHSLLINLGGGVVGDLGGFVAHTFKRGMPCINVPTTVLAQVDAAIGGKTGVNFGGLKNMVGTFRYPLETIVYTGFLNTLPKREVMSGFAEVIKHALIGSTDLWEAMCAAPYIDLPFIKSIIKPAAQVKADIVQRDFEERGERKKLNYGHTIGHAIESHMLEAGERHYLHGEAVAFGMMAETHISHAKGYITETLLNEINGFIARHYSMETLHESVFHRLIELMRHDKKAHGDKLNMTLIKGVGNAVVDKNPGMELVLNSFTYLQRFPFT